MSPAERISLPGSRRLRSDFLSWFWTTTTVECDLVNKFSAEHEQPKQADIHVFRHPVAFRTTFVINIYLINFALLNQYINIALLFQAHILYNVCTVWWVKKAACSIWESFQTVKDLQEDLFGWIYGPIRSFHSPQGTATFLTSLYHTLQHAMFYKTKICCKYSLLVAVCMPRLSHGQKDSFLSCSVDKMIQWCGLSLSRAHTPPCPGLAVENWWHIRCR